jgi:hypothetical protein
MTLSKVSETPKRKHVHVILILKSKYKLIKLQDKILRNLLKHPTPLFTMSAEKI